MASDPGFGLSGDLDLDLDDHSHLRPRPRSVSGSVLVLGVPSELACSSYLALRCLNLDSHVVKAPKASSCRVCSLRTRYCLSLLVFAFDRVTAGVSFGSPFEVEVDMIVFEFGSVRQTSFAAM